VGGVWGRASSPLPLKEMKNTKNGRKEGGRERGEEREREIGGGGGNVFNLAEAMGMMGATDDQEQSINSTLIIIIYISSFFSLLPMPGYTYMEMRHKVVVIAAFVEWEYHILCMV